MTTVVGVSRPIKEISTTNKQGSTNNIQMNVTLTLSRTDFIVVGAPLLTVTRSFI